MVTTGYSARHKALLKAVAENRGELVCGCYPSLAVDGRWCDQIATAQLVTAALVEPARPGPTGSRRPAVLTPAGAAMLIALAS
ncbi:hypothetical protein GCM10029964_086210 [Kibdelosporangium lantanae]